MVLYYRQWSSCFQFWQYLKTQTEEKSANQTILCSELNQPTIPFYQILLLSQLLDEKKLNSKGEEEGFFRKLEAKF